VSVLVCGTSNIGSGYIEIDPRVTVRVTKKPKKKERKARKETLLGQIGCSHADVSNRHWRAVVFAKYFCCATAQSNQYDTT